jgi:hypothetical protein
MYYVSKRWRGIDPGVTVWFFTPHGARRSGRVVLVEEHHVVVNTGGRHGTPAVVDEKNFSGHRRKGRKSKKQ